MQIAANMARLYSSDVVYKGYAAPLIAAALNAAGIGVGGTNGVQIESGQFVPDVQWLLPAFVSQKLDRPGQRHHGRQGHPRPAWSLT